MPLIKAKELDGQVMQAEVLRLQDIEAEGARIMEAARREAEAILAEARVQGERLKAEARKAGMEAGRVEGLRLGTEAGKKAAFEQGKADFAAKHASVASSLAEALKEFEAKRRGLLLKMQGDVVALAGAISHRVVKAAVEIDPSCVVGNIEEALKLIAERHAVEIRLDPRDMEHAREFAKETVSASGFESVRFVADETVGRGGAVLRTATGEVDATIGTQWGRLLDEILAEWKEHWLIRSVISSDGCEPAGAAGADGAAESAEPARAQEAAGT